MAAMVAPAAVVAVVVHVQVELAFLERVSLAVQILVVMVAAAVVADLVLSV
jgi:hypothetical protein